MQTKRWLLTVVSGVGLAKWLTRTSQIVFIEDYVWHFCGKLLRDTLPKSCVTECKSV